jgi:hypothetical protein
MATTHIDVLRAPNASTPANPLTVGAWLSVVGAIAVVVTSVFYVASPSAAAGPVRPFDLAAAMAGAASGAPTLGAAGTVGILGDLVWAVAAMLIAQELGRRGRGLAAAGWISLFLSIVIFTFVDGMTGFVLPPLAAGGDAAAFEGFRRLWDLLFQLGAIAYGVGVAAAFVAERTADRPMVGRKLALAIVGVGLVGALGAVGGLAGVTAVPTDKIAGGSIGLGSALLALASWQIVRGSRTN